MLVFVPVDNIGSMLPVTSPPDDRRRFSVKQRQLCLRCFKILPLLCLSTAVTNSHTAMSATTSTQTATQEPEPSRFDALKNNVSYLAYGSAAGVAVPASFKTRTVLKTTRYVLKYIFYRLIRYAKYAVIVRTPIWHAPR